MRQRLAAFAGTVRRFVVLVARIALGFIRMMWVIATIIPAAALALLAFFGGAEPDDVRKVFYPWTNEWHWYV